MNVISLHLDYVWTLIDFVFLSTNWPCESLCNWITVSGFPPESPSIPILIASRAFLSSQRNHITVCKPNSHNQMTRMPLVSTRQIAHNSHFSRAYHPICTYLGTRGYRWRSSPYQITIRKNRQIWTGVSKSLPTQIGFGTCPLLVISPTVM